MRSPCPATTARSTATAHARVSHQNAASTVDLGPVPPDTPTLETRRTRPLINLSRTQIGNVALVLAVAVTVLLGIEGAAREGGNSSGLFPVWARPLLMIAVVALLLVKAHTTAVRAVVEVRQDLAAVRRDLNRVAATVVNQTPDMLIRSSALIEQLTIRAAASDQMVDRRLAGLEQQLARAQAAVERIEQREDRLTVSVERNRQPILRETAELPNSQAWQLGREFGRAEERRRRRTSIEDV